MAEGPQGGEEVARTGLFVEANVLDRLRPQPVCEIRKRSFSNDVQIERTLPSKTSSQHASVEYASIHRGFPLRNKLQNEPRGKMYSVVRLAHSKYRKYNL